MSPVRGPRRHPLRTVAAVIVTLAAVVAVAISVVGVSPGDWQRVTSWPRSTGPSAPADTAGTLTEQHDAGVAPLTLGGPAPALPADPSPDNVAAAVTPSVVTVWTDIPSDRSGFRLRGAGTGILIAGGGDPDGPAGGSAVVLTNNHVISGSTDITVTHVESDTTFPATVLGYDRSRDIAILGLEGSASPGPPSLQAAALGEAAGLSLGQPIVAIGNAGGTGSLINAPGTVTGFDRSIAAQDPDGTTENLDGVIQIAADINPGDSGGPLADMTGHVVGVTTAKSDPDTPAAPGNSQGPAGHGYAVPIGDALEVARAVLTPDAPGAAPDGTVHVGRTALLGVHVRTRNAEPPRGAQVVDVVPDSPAAGAGIAAGDVITTIDGRPVTGADDLSAAIDWHAPDDVVSLKWVGGDGEPVTRSVTLGEGLPR